MRNIILETYMVALPIVLTSFMTYIIWMLKEQKKQRDANSKGTMMLLKIQLIEYHDKYCPIGRIPLYVYENCKEIYEAYSGLGGNGAGKHMWEEISVLEIGKGDNNNEENKHSC